MKKLQKVFAMLLTVCMVMSLLSVSALAAEKTSNIQVVEQGERFYYLASGEEAGPENFDVWTSKTIAGTENEDEFEITLQVGTTMKAVPNDVAVVLVMDTSGSMMWDESGNKWEDGNVPAGTKLRIEYAREAALEFAEAFATGAGSAKRMMSVVEFGNSAYAPLQWTDANDNGTLNEDVAEAIGAVDVNFKYDEGVSFWDQTQAEADFPGKTACWDGTIYAPEMKDLFEDRFQSYFQSSMTDYFQTYLVTEKETQEIEGVETEVDVTVCTYPECAVTTEHTHCAYEGCTVVEAHKHCSVEACAGATEEHSHCDYPECTVSEDHKHCAYEGCDLNETHTHCMYEGCVVSDAHTHCTECGETVEHTHVVGCTLSGCTDTTPDHVHYCVYGGHATYAPYYNGYRCLRTNPDHTHEMYDGDSCRTMEDRYEQKFRAIGTNMEGGLLLARNLVNAGQATGGAIEGIDDVYVIILTDGNPTFYTNSTSATETEFVVGLHGGFNKTNWTDVVDIVSNEVADGEIDTALAEDIKAVADLYAILYGTSMGQKLGGDPSHVLSGVTGANWFKTEGTNYVGADAVFDSPEAGGLNTVFAEIKDRIDMLAKAWVVTDEMGGIELGDDVTFEEFTLNGEYAAATPATSSKNTTISWSLGAMEPESGTGGMEDPYIYTLKYKVTLNSAKDNVKETSLAHDAGTSNEAVWTNNGASLQYFMVEEAALDAMTPEEIAASMRTAAFAKPSVKGIYGDYAFIKKNGETGEVMEGVGFTLYDSENNAYGSEVFSDSEGKVTFTNIPRGEYSLVETAVPDGMQQMSNLGLKVSWGEVTALNSGVMPEVIYNYKPYTGGGGNGGGGTTVIPTTPSNPDVNIDEEEVPLTPAPEVPVVSAPDAEEIFDEDVPLAMAPATGDVSALWLALSALSGTGLFLTRRKRDGE